MSMSDMITCMVMGAFGLAAIILMDSEYPEIGKYIFYYLVLVTLYVIRLEVKKDEEN